MSRGKKILIIDDEGSVGNMIQRILNPKYATSVFQSAVLALQKLQEEEFSLVFLDIKLHQADGFEVLQDIIQLHPGTKIVLMSGFIDPEIEARARKEAYKFLQKPFAILEVREIADEVMSA